MISTVFGVALLVSLGLAQDYECGGPGGENEFTDQGYAQYGDVTAFDIWHGGATCLIDGIRFKYGDVWGPKRSNSNSHQAYVEFAPDEFIVGVEMDKRTHWGTEALCKIAIYTNKRVYGPYCNYDCNHGRCASYTEGRFRYISGRYSGTLEFLKFHR